MSALTLCCLLWARPGRAADLAAYEDRVLAYLPDDGGRILQRMRADGAGGRPDEVQLFGFPDQAALDGFLADPRRLALTAQRDAAIERTELFPVDLLAPPPPG